MAQSFLNFEYSCIYHQVYAPRSPYKFLVGLKGTRYNWVMNTLNLSEPLMPLYTSLYHLITNWVLLALELQTLNP